MVQFMMLLMKLSRAMSIINIGPLWCRWVVKISICNGEQNFLFFSQICSFLSIFDCSTTTNVAMYTNRFNILLWASILVFQKQRWNNSPSNSFIHQLVVLSWWMRSLEYLEKKIAFIVCMWQIFSRATHFKNCKLSCMWKRPYATLF